MSIDLNARILAAMQAAADIERLNRRVEGSDFLLVDVITLHIVKPSDQHLKDLLCCALEGGDINSWGIIESYNYPPGQSKETMKLEFPHLDLPFIEGGSLTILSNMGDHGVSHTLDRAAMLRGLRVMAEKRPRHYADFVNENEDAITGDVFLQLSLFGEVIFG